MEDFVARENIRRFEAQLARCEDGDQKRVLKRLLKTERKRLNDIMGGSVPSMGDEGGSVPSMGKERGSDSVQAS